MMDIEPYSTYTAIVKIRDIGNGIKPECLEMNNQEVEVEAGFFLEDGIHDGECAMILPEKEYPITWIASGDLTGIKQKMKDM